MQHNRPKAKWPIATPPSVVSLPGRLGSSSQSKEPEASGPSTSGPSQLFCVGEDAAEGLGWGAGGRSRRCRGRYHRRWRRTARRGADWRGRRHGRRQEESKVKCNVAFDRRGNSDPMQNRKLPLALFSLKIYINVKYKDIFRFKNINKPPLLNL